MKIFIDANGEATDLDAAPAGKRGMSVHLIAPPIGKGSPLYFACDPESVEKDIQARNLIAYAEASNIRLSYLDAVREIEREERRTR